MDIAHFYQITDTDETRELCSYLTKLLQQNVITTNDYDYCVKYIRNKCPLIGSRYF